MKKNIYSNLCLIFVLLLSILLIRIGISIQNHNLSLIGLLILYFYSIFYLMRDLKNNIFLLIFYIVIFVFILSRPTISMLQNNNWWYISHTSTNWSMKAIAISLIVLLVSNIISNLLFKNHSLSEKNNCKLNIINKYKIENATLIRKILLILIIVFFIASIIVSVDKLMFMHGKNYEEYYVSYINKLPSIIYYLSALLIPSIMIYLVQKPSKFCTCFVLILYIISQIPMFIIGERGAVVKAILFSFLYLFYIIDKESVKKYINTKNVVFSLVIVFIGIIFLGGYNYIRSNQKISNFNPFSIFVDFFYKQGTTYDTINYGYVYKDLLPNKEEKKYTFGPIIDTVRDNSIMRKLFNFEEISNKNSIEAAMKRNDLSHALTYTVKKDDYLKGHGMGSSYLIELFIDYGYVGIIIFSFVIGIFLSNMNILLNKKNLISIISLYSIKEIYFIPRAAALSFIDFLFRVNFWISLLMFVCIIFIVHIYKKRKKITKIKNIAFIDYDITVIGGVEKVTETLANYFSSKYNVYVISLNKENDVIPHDFDKRISVIFSTNNKNKRLRTSIVKNNGKISKILRNNNIDVALCMGHYATFVTAINKRSIKTKFIYCDHGAYVNSINDKLMCFIRKVNYHLTTHTVLLTERNYNDYIKYIHAEKEKLSYIYNSISKEDFSTFDIIKYDKKSKNIITISRLAPEKGIDLLIAVAQELKRIYRGDWQWHVYGGGNMLNDAKNKIDELGLSSNVILKGECKNANLFLKEYALYCLTSYHEGLPLVLLEAKVNKLPIISFNVTTGPDEIVRDGVNGFLIDCYDVKMMAEKIKYLLENDKERINFSKNTKLDISKFNENNIMKKWDKLIKQMKEM